MLLCGVHRALVGSQSSSESEGWFRSTLGRLGRVLFRRDTSPEIRRKKMGIYDVAYVKSSSWNLRVQVSGVLSAIPLFRRLIVDVFTLYPTLTTMYILSNIWNSLYASVLLYTSTRLLKHIESAITSGQPNTRQILHALCIRLGFVLASSALNWATRMIVPRLTVGVNNYFNLKNMRANLRMDITAASTNSYSKQVDAWSSFETLMSFLESSTTTISQLLLVSRASREHPLFLLMCILQPFLTLYSFSSLWATPHIYHTENVAYKRMSSFSQLVRPTFRSEIIAGDLAEYVVDEYQKAVDLRGDLSDEPPMFQEMRFESSVRGVLTRIVSDFPVIWCAFIAITSPSSMTVSQFATWQQASTALDNAIGNLIFKVHRIKRKREDLESLYASDDTQSAMKDGEIAYPQVESEKSKGMSFELRNLSFSYPGNQNQVPTLRNISFVIRSGQLIVVVGANGSGKSTLIKLLTRLHDCSSPDAIIVDGRPISEYRLADLRKATAVLTQEHTLFPLSLGENIGMGFVDKVGDLEAITRAADQGGAKHYLEKAKDGLETTLDPKSMPGDHNLPADKTHPLNVEFEKLPKPIALSGGEKQRMVASRTFMRFESGRVKFVAVDEPTSALDAEGEATLFDNLIKAREGKTLVFVTHRFGHLTKRADLILCLKDGSLVESGTHSELLALDGEYAKLYNIQAGAFSDEEKVTEES